MSILNNQTGADYLKHYSSSSHNSTLYIDSDKRVSGPTNSANYTSSEIIRQEVSRVAVNSVHVSYNIPTININNAEVTFFSPASGSNHTVVLNEGYYTPTTLTAELQTQLNSVSGASLITFTISPFVGSTIAYTVTGTNAFQFITSLQVDRGLSCTGLYPMSAPNTSIIINTKCLYTSYIDFCISSLKEGQTRANTFSQFTKFPNSEHLFRQYIHVERGIYNDIIIDKQIQNLHYNKIRQRKLSELQIQVYDEYGDLFFEFPDVTYLSYALEISLLS